MKESMSSPPLLVNISRLEQSLMLIPPEGLALHPTSQKIGYFCLINKIILNGCYQVVFWLIWVGLVVKLRLREIKIFMTDCWGWTEGLTAWRKTLLCSLVCMAFKKSQCHLARWQKNIDFSTFSSEFCIMEIWFIDLLIWPFMSPHHLLRLYSNVFCLEVIQIHTTAFYMINEINFLSRCCNHWYVFIYKTLVGESPSHISSGCSGLLAHT